MKKLFLLILLIGSIQSIKATNFFNIQSLSIAPINTNDINVHLRTFCGNIHDFYFQSYSITGNVITISACYDLTLFTAISYQDIDILIPSINVGTTNYSLVVNIYSKNTSGCNYIIKYDTASLQFTTVLTTTVVLANDDFNNVINKFILYPNPNNGIFKINTQQNFDIEVYDILGQLVFTKKETQNIIETELKKGIYLVKIINEEGKTATQKMVID
jgi:hypothetical protein